MNLQVGQGVGGDTNIQSLAPVFYENIYTTHLSNIQICRDNYSPPLYNFIFILIKIHTYLVMVLFIMAQNFTRTNT